MGSLKRKLKRTKQKKAKKKMNEQLGLFDKMPDECLTCRKPYDKKSKEHVQTWRVVVREREDRVHLYCPTCWGKAIEFIDRMEEAENDTTI